MQIRSSGFAANRLHILGIGSPLAWFGSLLNRPSQKHAPPSQHHMLVSLTERERERERELERENRNFPRWRSCPSAAFASAAAAAARAFLCVSKIRLCPSSPSESGTLLLRNSDGLVHFLATRLPSNVPCAPRRWGVRNTSSLPPSPEISLEYCSFIKNHSNTITWWH